MGDAFTSRSKWVIVAVVVGLMVGLWQPSLPAFSQTGPTQIIESDDARVQQNGSWVAQSTPQASGGVYLYSGGNPADTLTLSFSGPRLEIVYLSGPSLGTLAIEIDNTVLRTLITHADQTTFQQHAVIDYLSDEAHTLRVYAAQGVIAVDAFIVPDVLTPNSDHAPINIDALVTTAQQQGTVRVLIGFDTPFVPEGQLSSARAVQTQRAAIVQGRRHVINALANQHAKINPKSDAWVIPYLAADVDAAALHTLAALPNVTSIEPDRLSDPTLASSTAVIDADLAWAMGYDGSGMTVAILDTGVQVSHPFLGGRVVAEACFSTLGGGNTTTCPNGLDEQIGPGAATPPTGVAQADHGTHVAGIAAGNGASYDGVAPNANIIAVQVFTRMTCDGSPCLRTWDSDWISGLNYVYSLRTTYTITSANMSLGGGRYYAHCDAYYTSAKTTIDLLLSVNIATVIAAGNDGYSDSVGGPGCISSAITIAASADDDTPAGFSNTDDQVDLFAPGVDITSSVTGSGYGSKNGTSMATPHVTGAWALIRDAVPNASVAQILAALQGTGHPITDTGVTRPRIDLDDAITMLLNPPAPPAAPSNAVLNTPTTTGLTLSWQDNATNEVGFYIYQWNGTSYVAYDTVLAGTTSLAITGLTCSTSYQFAVAAFNVGGTSAQVAATGSTALCPMQNDEMTTARYIGTMPYTYSQEANGSTLAGTDPTMSCAATYTNSVWYMVVPSVTSRITLNTTGSGYDTAIGVYRGEPGKTALSFMACNNDFNSTPTSQVTFDAFRNTFYYIMVVKVGSPALSVSTPLIFNATSQSLVNTADTLALFKPSSPSAALTYQLTDPLPASGNHYAYQQAGPSGAQWVMGDWNGDGQKTPGYYLNGAFYLTNAIGPNSTYSIVWIGPNGIPVAGRFSATMQNECFGVIEQGYLAPYVVFVLWYTCELGDRQGTIGGTAERVTTPTIYYQWVSAVLSDQAGFGGLGAHQFAVGDWNGDQLDTVAVRRGPYIAYSNVPITTIPAEFPAAQYLGAPSANDYGGLVAGDWDSNGTDSFGLYYQNGYFYRRNDLAWNSGQYILQRVGQPLGTGPIAATTWRVQ